jgi:hypothetical protein
MLDVPHLLLQDLPETKIADEYGIQNASPSIECYSWVIEFVLNAR